MSYLKEVLIIKDTDRMFSENMGRTHVNANNRDRWYLLFAFKLDGVTEKYLDILLGSVLARTNDDFVYEFRINQTLRGGSSTPTFNSVTDSDFQIAIGTGEDYVDDGDKLYAKYVEGNRYDSNGLPSSVLLSGSDELIITCRPVSTNLDILSSVNWKEIEI